jgi:hypothetical protein
MIFPLDKFSWFAIIILMMFQRDNILELQLIDVN